MNTKKFGIIALASIALLALLGCIEEQPPAGAECVAEGGTISVIAEPPECCAGLTLIPPKEQPILGISGYCTAKCGNGTCDTETESNLNCPADCKAVAGEQVVGPDAYANEAQAFDAMEDELEDMPELSDAELEALLGE